MREAAWLLIKEGIPEQQWLTVVETLRLLNTVPGFAGSPSEKSKAGVLERHLLLAAGSNDIVLRWLMKAGLVEHQIETTRSGAKQRQFRVSDSRRFGPRSCFVLTVSGLALAWAVGPGCGVARTTGRRTRPEPGDRHRTSCAAVVEARLSPVVRRHAGAA